MDSDQEDEVELEFGGGDNEDIIERGPPPPPSRGGASFARVRGVLASLCGITKFFTLRIRGTMQG